MNFKTPFKVLTTAALIGTLSLSAVAPGVASAADKTVTAQAETPANFALEKVILVKGDSKISVSFDTYIDVLGNEKALNGYELAYVVAANGEVFALDTYVDFYEAGNTEEEVVEKLSKAGKTSEVTEVKDGAFNDGKLEPVEPAVIDPKVESVTAINANELQVKFNKAVKKSSFITDGSAGALDSLTTGKIKIDGAASTHKVALSEDGKTLTIYAAVSESWEGAHSVEILDGKVKTTTGESVAATVKSFVGETDTTRATVTGIETVDKYTAKVNFSEPVDSTSVTSGISYAYVDGTTTPITAVPTVAADGKSATIVFDNATLAKDIKIKLVDLADLASEPNVSTPQTATFKIDATDKVAPTVESIKATSRTTVELTVSEPVKKSTLDSTKFTVNDVALAASKATLDKTGKVITLTIPEVTASKAIIAIVAPTSASPGPAAQAFTDLSGNQVEAWSKQVAFNEDTTAPELKSTELVKKDATDNQLKLTFSENVKKAGSANLKFTYTDEYGVEQEVTVSNSNVTIDTEDAKVVYVELSSSDFETGVDYKTTLPKGFFTDGFGNEQAEKEITFTNKSDAAVEKLTLATTPFVADTAAHRVTAKGAYLDVKFAKAVDVATATDAKNYNVEAATVKSVKLNSNDVATGATVRVFLEAGTVEETGTYNVTVSGVKGYSSSYSTMDKFTKGLAINENVAPTLKSAEITAFDSSTPTTTVTLAWTEEIASGAVNAVTTDFDVYVDGVKSSTLTATTVGTDGKTVKINADLSSSAYDNKKVTLKPATAFKFADAAGNIADVKEITVQ